MTRIAVDSCNSARRLSSPGRFSVARLRSGSRSASGSLSSVGKRVVVAVPVGAPPSRPRLGAVPTRQFHFPLQPVGPFLSWSRLHAGASTHVLRLRCAGGSWGRPRFQRPRSCGFVRVPASLAPAVCSPVGPLPMVRWSGRAAAGRLRRGPSAFSAVSAFTRNASREIRLPPRRASGTFSVTQLVADRCASDPWFSGSVVGSDGTRQWTQESTGRRVGWRSRVWASRRRHLHWPPRGRASLPGGNRKAQQAPEAVGERGTAPGSRTHGDAPAAA